jgi:hypothetical protein
VIPASCSQLLFSGYIVVWALVASGQVPADHERTTFAQKLYASRHLIPVVLLILVVLGSIYAASRPRPRPRRSASSARWSISRRRARSRARPSATA